MDEILQQPGKTIFMIFSPKNDFCCCSTAPPHPSPSTGLLLNLAPYLSRALCRFSFSDFTGRYHVTQTVFCLLFLVSKIDFYCAYHIQLIKLNRFLSTFTMFNLCKIVRVDQMESRAGLIVPQS